MKRVHYIGAYQDSSGYAVASRNYIMSIIKQQGGVNLSCEAASFERDKVPLHLLQEIEPYQKPGDDAQVRIIHLTPENFPIYRRTRAYNIGYTAWETDKLPNGWVDLCNHLQEIWTPSEWNVETFKRCGVKVPIKKLVHGFTLPPDSLVPLDIVPGQFLFYSIFQWISRKNPLGLLTAYFTEFKQQEPVVLLIKTYRQNTSPGEIDLIRQEVRLLKDSLNLPEYPKLVYLKDLLSSDDMRKLHARGDCFVLPSRGEGFGQPLAEAMAAGKPTIGPSYGGVLEFMNDRNSYLVDCDEAPVSGMTWMKHYHAGMNWAEPSISHLRKLMREVYTHQEEAKKRGQEGKKTIQEHFSWDVVGKWIVNRVNEL